LGFGSPSFGPGSASRFSGFRNGNLDGRNTSFRYPSPWWDIAHMDLPKNVKQLFRWVSYHSVYNPLVSSTARKMAAYPVTDVVLEDDAEPGFNKGLKRWEDCLYNVIDVHRLMIEVGLDYHTFGNAFASLFYPFHKYLGCRKCKEKKRIRTLKFKKEWDFQNFEYSLVCSSCGHKGACNVTDEWYHSYKDLRVIRWEPEYIDIDYNPITGSKEYAYTIPPEVRAKIMTKNRRYLEEVPDSFIRACRYQRPVVLHRLNIYHFCAPTPSVKSARGWGFPPILPALKDSFYLQVMKKAQEAVLMEHMVPLDVIFPTAADQAANPYMTVNLAEWKNKVEQEIGKWKWDPNYKPIMPLPLGHQRIGGDGRAMMLTQEIRVWSEHILAGMGVPQEFVFGGLTWSGSSVSLRMLENQFLTYREMLERFLRHFLVPNIARYMNWRKVDLHMKAFKMADDVQMKQLLINLNQMGKYSDKSLLAEFDKDAIEEQRIIEGELRRRLQLQRLEAVQQAEIQGEAQGVMQKALRDATEEDALPQQEAANQPPVAGQGGQGPQAGTGNVVQLSKAWAKRLQGVDGGQRSQILEQMKKQMPQMFQMVTAQMKKSVDMKPLPEQGPPRRAAGPI